MPKVIHIVRRFTFDEWGGTENVVWNTALQQRAMGVDASIFATAALSSTMEEVRDGVSIRRFDYFYPYFPMPAQTRLDLDKKGGNPFCRKLFDAIEHEGADILHVHSGGRLAQMACALARKMHIPCLMSLHGGFADVPQSELQNMLKPVKGKFNYGGIFDRIAGLKKDLMKAMDAVICVGRHEKELLKADYPEQFIEYLPNGIDIQKFERTYPVSPRREWNIPEDRTLLLVISRIDYQKNQKLALELLAREKNTHLLLVGPVTSEWYRDEIIARAKELNVADRLTIIPGLPPDDPRLVQILHDADVFIIPSLHEPFGIVALEAWASGLPVIASNVGGLKDFIVPERNGLLFSPDSPESLQQAFHRLTDTPGLAKTLADNAHKDVAAYSWPNVANRLMEIYNRLMSRNQAGNSPNPQGDV